MKRLPLSVPSDPIALIVFTCPHGRQSVSHEREWLLVAIDKLK